MNSFKFLNSLIQGVIIILLLYNAIKNNTLGMFEIIVTLCGVIYNLFTEFIGDGD